MKLQLLLFGITRDIIGQSKIELDYTGPSNIESFKDMLKDKYPEMSELSHFKIAVNQEFARDNQSIREGDEIALIPPVSGG